MDKIKVIISDNQKDIKIPTGIRMLVRRCCIATLRNEKFEGPAEVSVTFVDNEQIRELNKMHRKIDSSTDVLSFPMGENGVYDINHETGAKVLGDVVISFEKAIEQADLFGHGLKREVGYLTVHSVLHLLGHDHQVPMEKLRMREKEECVMAKVGLPGTESYYLKEEIYKS